MQGRAGALLTSGLAALALSLAFLQAMVMAHGVPTLEVAAAATRAPAPSNRYSAPGGRSGVPYMPFDEKSAVPQPQNSEDRATPPPKEHHTPPPSRFRSAPPRMGPQAPRKATA